MPRLIKGITNFVSSAAYTRSQSNRMVVPTPTANPWTAAMMGFLAPATATDETHCRRHRLSFPRLLHEIFQVVAGGESIAFAVQQDDANGGISLSLFHSIRQRVVHLGRQSILLLGTVDSDAHHSAQYVRPLSDPWLNLRSEFVITCADKLEQPRALRQGRQNSTSNDLHRRLAPHTMVLESNYRSFVPYSA